MAISTANVNTTTDTFNDWVNKTNNVATIISNNCITANGSLSLTTGNSYLNGFFSANTLIAQDAIRGGNNTTANVLNISTEELLQTKDINRNRTFADAKMRSNIRATNAISTSSNEKIIEIMSLGRIRHDLNTSL